MLLTNGIRSLPFCEGDGRVRLMSDDAAIDDNHLDSLAVFRKPPRTVIVVQTTPLA